MKILCSVLFTETRARASETTSSSVSEADEFQFSLPRTSPLVGSVRTETPISVDPGNVVWCATRSRQKRSDRRPLLLAWLLFVTKSKNLTTKWLWCFWASTSWLVRKIARGKKCVNLSTDVFTYYHVRRSLGWVLLKNFETDDSLLSPCGHILCSRAGDLCSAAWLPHCVCLTVRITQ